MNDRDGTLPICDTDEGGGEMSNCRNYPVTQTDGSDEITFEPPIRTDNGMEPPQVPPPVPVPTGMVNSYFRFHFRF